MEVLTQTQRQIFDFIALVYTKDLLLLNLTMITNCDRVTEYSLFLLVLPCSSLDDEKY